MTPAGLLFEHPSSREHDPRELLVSAGFDAHRADPLGGCRLETADFAGMACHVRDLADRFDAPLGAVLEGGYDPPALADCVLATLQAFSGAGVAESIAPDAILTPRAAAHVGHYWEL